MKIEQRILGEGGALLRSTGGLAGLKPQLVLVFGSRSLIARATTIDGLHERYPEARLVFASACGIAGAELCQDGLAITAVAFEKATVRCALRSLANAGSVRAVAQDVMGSLAGPDLVHVFVVADSKFANGTELARAFADVLPRGVAMTGGLASEQAELINTLVGLDSCPSHAQIVAVGFYGASLSVGVGAGTGWVPFGPERVITRSSGNTLYDLDGKSALQLYKHYLGDQAGVAGAALRFPLHIIQPGSSDPLVRASLCMNEAEQCLEFAGDMPMGSKVRFLRASYEDLIDGAGTAAKLARGNSSPELALCVSCIGRQVVLGQRAEEELENISDVLGPTAIMTGFYSHGELAPPSLDQGCRLHNETVAVTAFWET